MKWGFWPLTKIRKTELKGGDMKGKRERFCTSHVKLMTSPNMSMDINGRVCDT